MKFFERSRLHAEVEDELRSHIQHRADDLERAGLTRAEAERRARVEFGAYQRVREEVREAAGGTFVESLWQDLRYAVRVLTKSPGFTAVALITLALGIGANAVVFGVLNGLVLRPLNLPQEQSLYGIDQGDNRIRVVPRLHRSPRPEPQLREPGRVQHHGGRARHGKQSGAGLALRGQLATTSTPWVFSLTSVASFTAPMSTARTARRTSCSATPTGTRGFRMTAA